MHLSKTQSNFEISTKAQFGKKGPDLGLMRKYVFALLGLKLAFCPNEDSFFSSYQKSFFSQ